MEVEFTQRSARCEICSGETVTQAQGPSTQEDTRDSGEYAQGGSGGEIEVAQDPYQDQALKELKEYIEV